MALGKEFTSFFLQMSVTLCSQEGNHWPGANQWQPTARYLT